MRPFKPIDIAKKIDRKSNIIRAWLSQDKKAGLVEKTELGFYIITNKESITKELQRLKRKGAKLGSSQGSSKPKKRKSKTPQLCRLHNVQFYALIPGYTINNIPQKLNTWDELGQGPGTRRWELYPVVIPDVGSNCKIQVSAGRHKASLQMWLSPVFTNSHKLIDQLEAVHDAAQKTIRILAHEYKFNISLLEVKRPGHFAIKIPIRQTDKITATGFKMVGGKVWVNEDWWIDQSYGNELETANEKAFGELMDGLQKVGGIEERVEDIFNLLNKALNKQPKAAPVPPIKDTTGEEFT